MRISKRIMWIFSKSHREFFLYIYAIHSSSRHEKQCQMLERIFCLFQRYRNIQCLINQVCHLLMCSVFCSTASVYHSYLLMYMYFYINRARQNEVQQHLIFSLLMNPALKLQTNTIRGGRMSTTKSL